MSWRRNRGKSRNRYIANFLSRAAEVDSDEIDIVLTPTVIPSTIDSNTITTIVDSNYITSKVGSSTSTGGSSITSGSIDSAGLLPQSGTDGQIIYDKNLNDLYVWDSAELGWINPASPANFLIVRAGSFTAPVTGSETWSPTRTIRLKTWTADIDTNSGPGSLVFSVLKNGTSIGQGSISFGQTSATGTFSANTITSIDTISMNIDSGAGTSLSLDIDYV